MDRPLAAFVVVGVVLGLAPLASAMGWFGGVSVCGADTAPGCVTWPGPVSGVVWTLWVVGLAAVLLWHLRYLGR